MEKNLSQKNLIVNDQLLSYYYFEPSKKQNCTLLFLHGWRSNSQLWFKAVDQFFSKNYEIYFLDLPGFGKSGKLQKNMNLSDYSNIVNSFIKKLKIKKLTLIGHSFGGAIGIKLCAEKNIHIEKLILVDASGIRTPTTKKKISKFIAKVVKPVFMVPTMKSLRNKIYGMIGADDYVATPELVQTYVNVIKENLAPILSTIQIPTLLIWGDKDKSTPMKDAELMKAKIKNSQLQTLTGAGHFSFLDEPQEFQKKVIDFIET